MFPTPFSYWRLSTQCQCGTHKIFITLPVRIIHLYITPNPAMKKTIQPSKARAFTALLLLPLLIFAATVGDVRFRNIQTQNGLSNDDVNCVFKDSHGFMWFGTASGLNRYDGYSIRIFHSQRPDTTALRDNYVQDIQENADGNLWICAGDTYSIYNPVNERFSWFGHKEARKLGLPSEPKLILIRGKQMWFMVNDTELYRLDKGSRAVRAAGTTPGHSITDMIDMPDTGNIAAVNDIGELFIINQKGKIVAKSKSPLPFSHPVQFFLFTDQDGMIWVYSVSGTACFNPHSRQWVSRNICRELNGLSVKAIAQDDSGRIWFGTDNNGIYIVDKDDTVEHLTTDPLDGYSLPNNTVKSIYNSGDGGMWVGTYKKGVSVYYPSEYKFTSRPLADVNCITRNPNEYSSVWVGTDHSGLMKYNYSTGEAVSIADPRDPGHHAIASMMTDSNGNLWIGTYQGGLKKYSNGHFEYWNTGNGLSSNNIWAILEGNDGKIWLGTLDGGLQVYDPVTNTFRTFNSSNSKINSNYINTLTKGRDGSIFAGTTYGIARISPVDYSISTYQGSKKDEKDFSNLNINQLVVDSRGLVWVGTREGLEVYNLKSDTLYNLSLSDRFPNPFILGIIEGADHTMWVTVGNEIFNIAVNAESDGKEMKFDVKPYGTHDGILSGTFNQRSMCLLPTGELLAGSLEGILTINPEKISKNSNPPHVMFTGLAIKNIPVVVGKEYNGLTILPESMDYTDRIRLEHDQNDLTIYFATDNYSNSDHTVYKYRLEGFDDEWITCVSGTHHATYTNLPAGTYTFSVKATNSDGVESTEARKIKITIAAPWWASWWAKLLYSIIVIIAVTGTIIYFHRRTLAKLRQRQQEELAKKTEELNQLKFKFFTNISHELRTPLTLILSPVESMLKENPQDKTLRRLNTIKANANRLLYLVNQLLDFRKNEMASLTLHLSEGDIVTTIKNTCDSFKEFTDRKDITLEFDSSFPRLDMSFDNDKVTKILMNLLSNAVKYTPDGGSIQVSLASPYGKEIVISIADSGKGISDIDKQHIFERFYRGSDKSDLNTGTGIGLSLVYEYAKLHGGKVDVADNVPQGTVFSVILPIRNTSTSESPSATESSSGYTSTDRTSIPAELDSEAIPETEEDGNTKPSVLFVDDNRDLIEFLKDEFSDTYSVSVAYNGVEALKMIKQKEFDLVVTDLMMPEMDGIEFARRLKSDAATVDIPLIMLTAKQDMGAIIEGLTLGADDYITKPFNNEILALKMKRLINLKKRGLKRTLIDPTPSKIEITSLDKQLIDKAVNYVEENISRSDLSVEELAREMGMSRVHLYKKISALTGKSPIEFIRLLRLKRATQYLAESQLTIAEIAYRLGFNNPKYFSKYFKEEFGILPSEYQVKTGS